MLRSLVVGMLAMGLSAGCAENDTSPPSWRFEPIVAGDGARATVRGVVRDELTGDAIAGARITFGDATTSTDASGRYALFSEVPGAAIRAEHPLYLSMERLSRGLADRGADLTMFPASPPEDAVDRYLRALQEARVLRDDASDPALRPEARAILRGDPPAALSPSSDAIGVARGALDAPPATIRLWRRSIDGASESCSGRIDVIDFEEYIKGVLPHEWIPSWHDESLRAGSLAIRTYAWNWIARGGKYDCADLDDTTRSQVYRDDRNDRASAAVDTTRGSGITRGGTLVSGEYSAENSDPTADGVSDPLCTGRELFGHGRGMCQWGSQRWALDGRDHVWIATHYWPGSGIEGGAPPVPGYAASFVGMEVPPEMVSGDRATAWVELRNDGSATWDLDGTRLGTTRPNDHDSVFFDVESWMSPNRASGPDHSGYGPGVVGRFSFVLLAPEVTSEQVIAETFGLVQEGVTWFGPDDIRMEVRVRPRTPAVVDADGDGSSSEADCDDADPARRPGADEACDDGIDQDCNGADLPCSDPPLPGVDGGAPTPPPARDASTPPPSATGPAVVVTSPPAGAGGSGAPREVTGSCAAMGGSTRARGSAALAGLLGLACAALLTRRRTAIR
ncbi:MAG: hypothetical protein IT379_21070 [Deltaproteobacteria bacterium]|nr:hypothetical protein [Deltaproteobacteria bacterium]